MSDLETTDSISKKLDLSCFYKDLVCPSTYPPYGSLITQGIKSIY